jgi:D-amino-acid dehydrogenase
LNFYKNANTKFVENAAPALKNLSILAKHLYKELFESKQFDFNYHENGLVLYCNSAKALEEEVETAHFANKLGLETKVFDANSIKTLEPKLDFKGAGAVFYPGDAHLNPRLLTERLRKHLTSEGVVIHLKSDIKSFDVTDDTISKVVLQTGEAFNVEKLILAAGVWSQDLAKMLRQELPLQAGKGYSVEVEQTEMEIKTPCILVESRVAITPFDNHKVRFGGTMEIAGQNHKINLNRVKGIAEAIPKYFKNYPEPGIDESKVWHGLRPCSPDGLPYIGKSPKLKNLYVNSGHAMMGISLAPASGKILAQIVCEERSDIDIEMFRVDRF